MTDPLYIMRVEGGMRRQQILQITGGRDTILEAAVRVMLDCAPAWDVSHPDYGVPSFTVTVQEIK